MSKKRKIFLAKGFFIYYLNLCKEFSILSLTCRARLFFFLAAVTFQTNAFADIKEQSAAVYRSQGYEAQQKGNLQEALSFYAKAISLGKDSDNIALFNDTGVIYEQLGLLNKAEDHYLQALRLDNQYLPAYSNLAYLYKRQGNTDKAIEFFKKRVEWGRASDPWTQKAKSEISQLAKNDPKVQRWLVQQEIAGLTEEVIRKEREDFTNRLVQADEFYQKGRELAKAGKYKQAMEEYQKALALTPQNPNLKDAFNEARLESLKIDVKESSEVALKMLNQGDVVSAKVEFRRILATIPNEPIQISK